MALSIHMPILATIASCVFSSETCDDSGACPPDVTSLLQTAPMRHRQESESNYWHAVQVGTVPSGHLLYEFEHDGHCATGYLRSQGNTVGENIDSCAARCESVANCAYFFFGHAHNQDGSCALYTQSGNCQDDNAHGGGNAYRLNRVQYELEHDGHCASGYLRSQGNTVGETIGSCAARCNSVANCAYFFFGHAHNQDGSCALYSQSGNCRDDDAHGGGNAYRLLYSQAATDTKCPFSHGDRLFRTPESGSSDITLAECYSACASTTGCNHFSHGPHEGGYVCMGCSTLENAQTHTGFTAYDMAPPPTPNLGYSVLHQGVYLSRHAAGDSTIRTVNQAQARCDELGEACGGITCRSDASCTVRAGHDLRQSPSGEYSFVKTYSVLHQGFYLSRHAAGDSTIRPVNQAQARCDELGEACGGITCRSDASCTVRAGHDLRQSPSGEYSFVK